MMEVGNGASSASPSVDASRLAPSNSSPSKDKESLSHVEVIEKSKEGISRLLSDPFLSDLSKDISLDEVKSVLALEQGKAITLHLRRFDDEVLSIIVMQGSTVHDLVKAVEKAVVRRCSKNGLTTYISWRSVWRNHWLVYGQQKLTDRNAKIVSYGIGNNAELSFQKKLRRENKAKRPKRNTFGGP